MRIGTEEGYSIPASVIIPNRQYGQADQTAGSMKSGTTRKPL